MAKGASPAMRRSTGSRWRKPGRWPPKIHSVHEVLGSFSSRISPAGAGRAGENIAYGYDTFEKTLDQWINSPEHRRNLLLHNASRIGVASVKSETSHRTYWAMEIAGDYSSRMASRKKPGSPAKKKIVSRAETKTAARTCRIRLLGCASEIASAAGPKEVRSGLNHSLTVLREPFPCDGTGPGPAVV